MRFPSLKSLFINGFVFFFSLSLMLVLAELTLRWIDNYELFSLQLNRLNLSVQTAQNQGYTLDQFVKEFSFSSDVDPQWIYTSPEPLPKFQILEEHQARHQNYDSQSNYVWNENFINQHYGTDTTYDQFFQKFPSKLYLFNPAYQTEFPRYRYPANVSLPTGITTNQFGWRGPQIELNKPDNTIRIACVGASTTVSAHGYSYSYPEFMQHWLNLWSQYEGYNINFEVINAGREGINSNDIATIVRYELLPLEPDYVIYYEGSNQFNLSSMVQYPSDVTFSQPPEGLVPNFTQVDSTDKSLLDKVVEYSAIGQRIRSGVEAYVFTGMEPPKPEQSVNLPASLDETNPDLTKLDGILNLSIILNDLNQIKQDLDKHNAQLIMSTFNWFVYDGMTLDPVKYRGIYVYLNRAFWPITYANMRRAADFQNAVFEKMAKENDIMLMDIAGQMPKEPDLYSDAIHNTDLGIRIRAWINFQAILPHLKLDIESGALPLPDQEYLTEHPHIEATYYSKIITRTLPIELAEPAPISLKELSSILADMPFLSKVEFYNEPSIHLSQNGAIISGQGNPVGVHLVYEIDPTQTYRIVVRGADIQGQAKLQIRRNQGEPEVLIAPHGQTELTLSGIEQLELLLYADEVFAYYMNSITLEPCENCKITEP